MRIIILSQYYEPEPLPKLHELAHGLRDRGHRVTVVTGFPNYPYGKLYSGYSLRPWTINEVDGIRVVRLPLYPDHSWSTRRRMMNYGSFAFAAATLGPWLCGAADVMYVWHPPLTIGFAALAISMARRVPFVYAVHDLWPEQAVALGLLKEGRAVRMLERFESFVYRRASVVGVVSPGYIDHLAAKGVPRDKIEVLTDWVDDSVYRPVPYDRDLAQRLQMAGKFNVVFGGQFGVAQNLDTLLDAAWLLLSRHEFQFVLVGDGPEHARIEQKAKTMGLTNVRFLGRYPANQMPAIYSLGAVLLIHLKALPEYRMSIPGKTYVYMACGKPIVAAVAGTTAEIIADSSGGIVCPPEDPQAMVEAITTIFEMSAEERARMGDAARRAAQARFSRTAVIDEHERVLAAVGSAPGDKGRRQK
jgi:glycosyltransferase involved in cell wall biosynthesis